MHRPNHGLCHGVRQGLLAVKIAQMINLKCDLYKLQVAASFQRSGRKSEASSAKDHVLYKSYEEQDVKNCLSFLDDASAEAIAYANAIRWDTDSDIAKVLHAAHHFERLPLEFEEREGKR